MKYVIGEDIYFLTEKTEEDKLRHAINLVEQAIDIIDNGNLMEAHYELITKLYQLTGDTK